MRVGNAVLIAPALTLSRLKSTNEDRTAMVELDVYSTVEKQRVVPEPGRGGPYDMYNLPGLGRGVVMRLREARSDTG